MSRANAAEPVCGTIEATGVPGRGPSGFLDRSQLSEFGYSLADQAFAVGGMFVVNIGLARAGTKEEYGIFALSYSIVTFLTGLHNAAILEAYTVYGAGRYHPRFPEYERFVARRNGWFLAGLTFLLIAFWAWLRSIDAHWASPPLLGMSLSVGILLSASFRRRTFYIERRPEQAALFSMTFFFGSVALLGVAAQARVLNGLAAFLIVSAGWLMAFALLAIRKSGARHGTAGPDRNDGARFDESDYWQEHWRYSRWVFATALVFQFTSQAYFWAVAGFLSVERLAALRALYNLALPIDQIYTAITLLLLPRMAYYFSRSEMGRLGRLGRQCALANLLLSSTFALVVGAASERILHAVYRGKFDDAAPLLRWYVLVPVVMGAGNAANAVLKAMERPQTVLCAYLASGAVTFLAGIPLVIHLGLRGAIYGMLLSAATYTATLTLSLSFSFRRLGHSGVPLVVH